ncbi:hypothetical protein [Methanobrevibacter sp.]|uniref:hypothetical protein n=1 Tax=Methanobrevibacter sp. TaxID=66852 RepID=UPI00388D5202
MNSEKEFSDMNYSHYNDFYFKSVLHKRANGLLKFIGIPYKIERIILSEYTTLEPGISRIDFAGDARKDGKTVSLILECQSKLPTDEDINRFFRYVASLRIFKNNNVDLYILCTQKAQYDKKEFIINDECIYTMHVISLKEFKAREIFKNIEDKLKNNREVTDDDIASLQVIVYTDHDEPQVEILLKARELIERIAVNSKMDINEKTAIIRLLDVLSTNMLEEDELNQYEEETYMLLNPTDRFLLKKGKLDVAKNMIKEGYSIEEIVKLTGLSKNDVLNAK